MSKNLNSESNDSSLDTDDVVSETETGCIYNELIDNQPNISKKIVPKEERISKNILTRYEFVRIIGERTKQLSMGAKPLIKINKNSDELDYKEIAIEELKLNMLPFKIKRPLNKGYEVWTLDELNKEHLESFF